MGWFSDVTNFLSSPGFRIGAGVAGLAAGAGAFEGLGGFGDALTYGAGAANLVSGAASTFGPNRSAFDRATGALQMGLGGYNLFQNETTLPFGAGTVGGYGTFDTVYDRITNPDQYEEFSFYKPALGIGEGTGMPSLAPQTGGRGDIITTTQTAQPDVPTPSGEDEVRRGITGAAAQPLPGSTDAQATMPRTVTATGPLALAGGPGASPSASPGGMAGVPGTIASQGGGATIGGLPVVGFANGQAIVQDAAGRVFRAAIPQMDAPSQGFSGFFDRLINYASSNPMQATMSALQIGGMLVSLFGRSQADIAREAMERMSPGSADATEFRRLYEERARREIDRQYQEVRSALDAKFSARGMMRSTVYTTALDQLERSRIDLSSNLPFNSLQAWNQVAQNMGQSMRSAAGYAQVAAPQLDFSSMTRVLAQSPLTQSLAAGR